MAFESLVVPVGEPFRSAMLALAKKHGYVSTDDPKSLGEAVRKLSAVYNRLDGGAALPSREARSHLAARLAFSLPRDVPKGAGAVRELVGTGFFRGKERLRVLDVGAGLGAMTLGLRAALEASGHTCAIDAKWLDADGRALALAEDVARALHDGPVPLAVTTATLVAPAKVPRGPFDVILVGQTLSELDEDGAPEARAIGHAAWLAQAFESLAEDGALVVVEPALRDRARHLSLVRDVLAARGLVPFAPCLHAAPCPILAREDDWCHEDLDVDLPPWLVPVARAAGLRHEGLSFSYLVLRRDGRRLTDVLPNARVRVVSDLLRSKGKTEAHVCGVLDAGPCQRRLRRLDRMRTDANAAWDEARRGVLFAMAPLEGERIDGHVVVERVER